jgi:hypothetical protein
MPQNFVVLSYGPDQDKLKLALGSGLQLAKEFSTKLTIVVPTLGNAPGTILRHVIGQKAVDHLAKGGKFVSGDVPIYMRSIRTICEWDENGVVVALWGGSKMLGKVDKCNQAKAIIVLSWIESDVTNWQKQSSAVVLGEQAK